MSLQAIPYLFKTQSRQDVPDAPVYDPSEAATAWLNGKQLKGVVKTWIDPRPASDPASYPVLMSDNSIGTLTMSARFAGVLNLAGHPDYPHYAPAPSAATFNGGPLPFGVVSEAEAGELSKELGGAPVMDLMAGFAGSFPLVYPADDPRRAYSVGGYEAARLLAAKNANGVGSPGHWDVSQHPPAWVADLPAPGPDTALLPVPLAPFPAGAKIVPGSIVTGGLPMLEVPDSSDSSSSNSSGSLFTAEHAKILERLGSYLTKWGS